MSCRLKMYIIKAPLVQVSKGISKKKMKITIFKLFDYLKIWEFFCKNILNEIIWDIFAKVSKLFETLRQFIVEIFL